MRSITKYRHTAGTITRSARDHRGPQTLNSKPGFSELAGSASAYKERNSKINSSNVSIPEFSGVVVIISFICLRSTNATKVFYMKIVSKSKCTAAFLQFSRIFKAEYLKLCLKVIISH